MTQLEITKLPLPEKLRLMESLWDAICHEPSGEPSMPDWHESVLAERLERLDAGAESVAEWDEAKKRLRDEAERR